MDSKTGEYVGYHVKILDRLFRKEIENFIRSKGFEGMTCVNGWILGYLARNEDKRIFQKDLEQEFRVGRSSMSVTLKIMEEKCYIVRQSVPGDARLKQVILTEKGRSFLQEVEESRRRSEEKVTRGLSDKELAQFFSTIRKMCENLSA